MIKNAPLIASSIIALLVSILLIIAIFTIVSQMKKITRLQKPLNQELSDEDPQRKSRAFPDDSKNNIDENKNKEIEISELKMQLKDLRKENDRLQVVEFTASRDKEKLEKALKDQNNEIEKVLRDKNNESNEKIQMLESEVAELTLKLSKEMSGKKINELSVPHMGDLDLKKQNLEFQKTVTELKEEIRKKEVEIEKLKLKNDELKNIVDDLERTKGLSTEKSQKIENLNKDIENLNKELELLKIKPSTNQFQYSDGAATSNQPTTLKNNMDISTLLAENEDLKEKLHDALDNKINEEEKARVRSFINSCNNDARVDDVSIDGAEYKLTVKRISGNVFFGDIKERLSKLSKKNGANVEGDELNNISRRVERIFEGQDTKISFEDFDKIYNKFHSPEKSIRSKYRPKHTTNIIVDETPEMNRNIWKARVRSFINSCNNNARVDDVSIDDAEYKLTVKKTGGYVLFSNIKERLSKLSKKNGANVEGDELNNISRRVERILEGQDKKISVEDFEKIYYKFYGPEENISLEAYNGCKINQLSSTAKI